jgi:hypothetical protein
MPRAKKKHRIANDATGALASGNGSETSCQIKGCSKPAVVEISGYALKKPGWWRACQTHRYVFAAQRQVSPNEKLTP